MPSIHIPFIPQPLKNIMIMALLFAVISIETKGQTISNPTVLNSMNLTNITSTSAKLNWMYWSNEFDSSPVYILYSRTASQAYFQTLSSVSINAPVFTSNPQSLSLNVTGLLPNTTYTWFLNVLDEARGMSEPLLMNNYNNGTFLGLSFLTTSTYQLITFTTPNTNGTGGSAGVLTTITNSSIPPNQLPFANAGPDIVLPFGATSTNLNGLGSFDNDGGIMSFNWVNTEGPSVYTLSSCCGPQISVSNLTTGTYTFRLTITDSRGSVSSDLVNIIVNSGNQPPIVNAGPDQIITLPTNSITLNGSSTDADGTITTNVWSVLSGPSIYGLSSPNSTSSVFRNLQQGTYTLQLRATDNSGSSSSDVVLITVNPGTATCTNDNFEPNNSVATASTLNNGIKAQARLCPLSDQDFFKIKNTNNKRNLRVTLSNLPSIYAIELFDPNGSLVGMSNAANTQNKTIVFNTTTVGTYTIKVSASLAAVLTNGSYSLLAEIARNPFPNAVAREAVSNEIYEAEQFENSIQLFPNPAHQFVNIQMEGNSENANISIFNLGGQLVGSFQTNQDQERIPLVGLDAGIYVIKINRKGQIPFVQKLVVNPSGL